MLLPEMRLDVAARSRPVLHDVAARQVRQARVPRGAGLTRTQGNGPPAHRIRAAVLPLATIVVADLELRCFTTVSRVDARRHVSGGGAHHETRAPSRDIGEHIGEYSVTAEGVDAIVDRYVPGHLKGVTVDFDLAFFHKAAIGCVHRQKDVEPERKFPGEVGGRVPRSWGRVPSW